MLTFSSISAAGFTFTTPDGTATPVSRTGYDDPTAQSYQFQYGMERYVFSVDFVTWIIHDMVSHTQITAADTWTITHGLNRPVVCNVTLPSNETILPASIEPTDSNILSVTFTLAQSGKAQVR